MRLVPVLVIVALLGVGGCTSSGDDPGAGGSPSGSASDPAPSDGTGSEEPGSGAPDTAAPSCDEVWRTGETLPADYESCALDGRVPAQEQVECQDGPPLVVFDDVSFARPGQEVVTPEDAPMQDGPEFAEAYSACTGE